MNLNADLNAPIDSLQKACMAQRDLIRKQVEVLQGWVAGWTPQPMPPDWNGHD